MSKSIAIAVFAIIYYRTHLHTPSQDLISMKYKSLIINLESSQAWRDEIKIKIAKDSSWKFLDGITEETRQDIPGGTPTRNYEKLLKKSSEELLVFPLQALSHRSAAADFGGPRNVLASTSKTSPTSWINQWPIFRRREAISHHYHS